MLRFVRCSSISFSNCPIYLYRAWCISARERVHSTASKEMRGWRGGGMRLAPKMLQVLKFQSFTMARNPLWRQGGGYPHPSWPQNLNGWKLWVWFSPNKRGQKWNAQLVIIPKKMLSFTAFVHFDLRMSLEYTDGNVMAWSFLLHCPIKTSARHFAAISAFKWHWSHRALPLHC